MSIETTYSQARAQLKKLMDRAVDDREVIVVRRREGGDVAMIAADELEFGESEQDGLHSQAHFSEFVQEQCPVVSLPNQPRLVPVRSREASPHMPKKLGLKQGLRDAAAVDGNKRTVQTCALRVDQLGDDFFTDTSLAKDEHLGFSSGSCLDVAAQLNEGWALA